MGKLSQLKSLQRIGVSSLLSFLLVLCSCSNNEEPFEEGLSQSDLVGNVAPPVLDLSGKEKAYIEYQNAFDGFYGDGKLDMSNVEFSLDRFLNIAFACNYTKSVDRADEIFQNNLSRSLKNGSEFTESIDYQELNELSKKILNNVLSADKSNVIPFKRSVWKINETTLNDEKEYKDLLSNYYNKELISVPDNNMAHLKQWFNSFLSFDIVQLPEEYRISETGLVHYSVSEWTPSWQIDFTSVEKQNFKNDNGSTTLVEMMSNSKALYKVFNVQNVGEVIEVPLGNGAFSIYFIRDDEKSDALTKLKKLRYNIGIFNDKVDNSDYYLATIKLPKLRISMINSTLNFMMADPDFESSREPLRDPVISSSEFHFWYSVIDFKPVGPYRSISTTGCTGNKNMPQGDEFVLDRPFRFVVVSKATGVILFDGAVWNI